MDVVGALAGTPKPWTASSTQPKAEQPQASSKDGNGIVQPKLENSKMSTDSLAQTTTQQQNVSQPQGIHPQDGKQTPQTQIQPQMGQQVQQLQQNQQQMQQQQMQGQQMQSQQQQAQLQRARMQQNPQMQRGPTTPVPWQSEADLPQRRKMITKIVSLLQQRKPNAPPEWVQKLPDMARRLEDSLYRTASSVEEYGDFNTLKERLQHLALSMGARAAKKDGGSMNPTQIQKQQQMQAFRQQQQMQQGGSATNADGSKVMVNMNDINPMMHSQQQMGMNRQQSGSMMTQSSPGSMQEQQQMMMQQRMGNGQIQGQQGQGSRAPTAEQRQHVLRQQQQRLLLLRHASKCPQPEGQCRATPYCADMKRLWAHIAKCKDQRCQVPHCVSSRYVLSHYHRCKDARCAVCGPVREAIQRHHERAKTMAQQHQSGQGSNQLSLGDAFLVGSNGNGKSSQHAKMQQKQKQLQVQKQKQMQQAMQNRKRKQPQSTSTGTKRQKSSSSSSNRKPKAQQLQEGTSLVNTFDEKQIKAHVVALERNFDPSINPGNLKEKVMPVLRKLMDHKYGFIFSQPVDPVALNIPDYFNVITNPMDLGTIKKRLEAGYYKLPMAFGADVRMTFDNAIKYNEDQSPVNAVARELSTEFEKLFKKVMAEIRAEEKQRREGENACRLCGGERLTFEPLVFYCNGTCNMKIRRNSYYYTDASNKFHWCTQCYSEIKDDQIVMGETTLSKKALVKKKNNEEHEEGWVQCETCHRWVHQICALFNGRNNQSDTRYHCPICVLEKRKQGDVKFKALAPVAGASELKGTKMGDYIENRVLKMIQGFAQAQAKKKGCSVKEIEIAKDITIKMVSNIDKTVTVRERMFERYKDTHKYSASFDFKSRCVLMFQTQDGVDVLLFGMYVHEFGHSCPEPNRRRVYVSYLDTVKYLQPPSMRTPIYHELLIAYLDFAKAAGHHTAHIWACPPLKGDDYILYCKPDDQKTPRAERLRAWYITMLEKGLERGVVTRLTNMHLDHFEVAKTPHEYSTTTLPYFEGDYWPGVAEDFIKQLDEKKKKKDKDVKPSGKGKAKNGNKKGTRSSGPASKHDGKAGDDLMDKLASVLEPMKEDFIVVKMREECLVCMKPIETAVYQDTVDEKVHMCENCLNVMKALPALERHPIGKEEVHEFKKVKEKLCDIVDGDPEQQSEHFDTRQTFLTLCQGNHYQFDHLRRAKHSTMMVLYHLHNPDAPRFVHSCSSCHADIMQGVRWTCEKCSDFDLCPSCKPKIKHQHPLKAVKIGGQTAEGKVQDEAARRERARSIKLHMQLLVHASGCVHQKCPSANCSKMKALLKHGATCIKRATGGCNICRRIWALLQIHARQCRTRNCPVPRCRDLKEHLRRLRQQQAAMEDRRRQAVTDRYRNPQ